MIDRKGGRESQACLANARAAGDAHGPSAGSGRESGGQAEATVPVPESGHRPHLVHSPSGVT